MSEALFVAGSGGVGKTTLAGALALAAAARGNKTLVVTVDPAKRLAQALGLEHLTNDPVRVPGTAMLHAAMLDAAASWESLVHRHTDVRTAERVISNRFFRAVADRFPSGQAYAVAEETARLAATGEYDAVIVDTPPVGGGVDFFDAPKQIRGLVAGKALRLLTGPPIPGKRAMFAITTKPALRLADRILGGPLLQDAAEFLLDLRTTYDGVRRRSREVQRLLDGSGLIVATTLEPGPAGVALSLLEKHKGPTRAILANRVIPAAWADAGVTGDDPPAKNLQNWGAEARRQAAIRAELAAAGPDIIETPLVSPEPASLVQLEALAQASGLGRLFTRAQPPLPAPP